jgi:hypothetical protein
MLAEQKIMEICGGRSHGTDLHDLEWLQTPEAAKTLDWLIQKVRQAGNETFFSASDFAHMKKPYRLTEEEQSVVDQLHSSCSVAQLQFLKSPVGADIIDYVIWCLQCPEGKILGPDGGYTTADLFEP